ncbi:MAG: hypothetical protein EAZ88_14980 [Oscillatoriales cyanobacterium]|nr:MAG: hypothetical protein EAZ93_26270 [Oscillatoriales cyanobacterium]TAE52495.1 MAG: hypothetical protein EAZ88_14980 [Oscillatoriales cyanobacterium]TAE68293.1 MAG: hypothetical protein EAZ86_13970 [Oscillatoriales cyanobacterium]
MSLAVRRGGDKGDGRGGEGERCRGVGFPLAKPSKSRHCKGFGLWLGGNLKLLWDKAFTKKPTPVGMGRGGDGKNPLSSPLTSTLNIHPLHPLKNPLPNFPLPCTKIWLKLTAG